MIEIRCSHCRKLLARGQFHVLEIKCPRCGNLNHMSAKSAAPGATDGSIPHHSLARPGR
ncbi:MAG: Com family DNA-binding transcriptional regulator [Formivibrio sp.]|nr:Com family DNA-binding transcriptional regulator [Formivibrio sp.]